MTILLFVVLSHQVCAVICMSVSLSLSFSYMPKRLSLRDGGVVVGDQFWEFHQKKSFYIAVMKYL